MLLCLLMANFLGASAVASASVGTTDGAGNINLSARIDFGGDSSTCGESAVCDSLNASCLAKAPKLQPELCQDLGSMSVEYVTTATEQVSSYFMNNDCSGGSVSSESVQSGECKSRGDNNKEARQYFPLVGVCNNESTGGFIKQYISYTPMYGSAEYHPTDVCLSSGEGESDVWTVNADKVFRVRYDNSSCVGTPESVADLTSGSTVIPQTFCLDFATVHVDWNLDGIVDNDGRNVTAEVVTTTTTSTTTTTTTTTTTETTSADNQSESTGNTSLTSTTAGTAISSATLAEHLCFWPITIIALAFRIA